MATTTIQIEKNLLSELKKAKQYERQTYSEIIQNMLEDCKKRRNQYDELQILLR